MRHCEENFSSHSSVSPVAWPGVGTSHVQDGLGEDRVYFYNEEQQLTALPASWTDLVAADPFVSIAAGRAPFRADDLLELVQLIHHLSAKGSDDV